MPRPSNIPIQGTDASTPQRNPLGTDVVASPVSTFVQPADSDLSLLADSLGKIHEPLAQMQSRQNALDRADAVAKAKAAAATEPNPQAADVAAATANTPPAFQRDAAVAFNDGIGTRLGVQAKDDFLSAYNQAPKGPDFNFDQFAAQFRQKQLAGLGNNPYLLNAAAPHIDSAIEAARADYRGVQEKRLVQERNSNLSAAVSGIDLNADSGTVMSQFQGIADSHVAQGGTRAEAAQALFDQAAGASMRQSGRPDMFNVFFQPVPGMGNKALVDLLPGMKDKVASEQEQAVDFRIKELRRDNLGAHADFLANVQGSLLDGSAMQKWKTPEEFAGYLKSEVNPAGAIPTARMYSFLMERYMIANAGAQSRTAVAQAMTNGTAGMFDEKLVKPVLSDAIARSGAYSTLLTPGAKPEQLSAAINQVVQLHAHAGVTFPDDKLKGYFNSIKLEIPGDNTPASPKFQAAASAYAAMKQLSGPLANAYFDKDTAGILSEYNRLTVNGQVDSKTAVKEAFASVDPERVKAAEEAMKDPTMRAKVSSVAAEGVSFWRRHFPFGQALGIASDTTGLARDLQAEGVNYAKIRPQASASDIADHLEEYRQANYFREPATNQMVQVPPAYNNPTGQDAITNYLSIVKNQPGNADMKPSLVPKGNGVYDLFFYPNGVPVKAADNVSIDTMLALRSAQKVIQPSELPALKDIRTKLESGTATAEDIKSNELLLTKVRSAGLWPASLQNAANRAVMKSAQESTATTLEPALRSSAYTVVNSPDRFSPTAAIQPKGPATSDIATQFLQQGNYAGALAAQGEGVRSTAYTDKTGHTTIGIGYNMDSNDVTADFRRAGIPVEQIAAIKAGQVHLTNDQVMRLYGATAPRYTAIAQKAVEGREPGAWAKLPPNVQAVLTDVAYQTGNLHKFQDSLDKVIHGDFSGTGFVTQYKAVGAHTYTVDDRRHNLRAAMMSSPNLFKTLLTHAAQQPANAVQQSRLADAAGAGS